DFIIGLAPPGVPGADILRLQNELILRAQGATEEQIAAQLAFLDEVFLNLDDPEVIAELGYENAMAYVESLPEDERAVLGDVEAFAEVTSQSAVEQFGTPWFQFFLEYDPAPDWAKTTVPVLVIFGGKDLQVDAGQNMGPLEAALASGGNDNVEIIVLPEAN